MKRITLFTLCSLMAGATTISDLNAAQNGRFGGGRNDAVPARPGGVVPGNTNRPDTPRTPGGQGEGRRLSDQLALRQSVQMARMEIALGELALSNSVNTGVHELAQHLVQDHSAQLDQAQVVADELGVTLPDGLASRDQAALSRLQGLSGEQFDRAWIQTVVNGHVSAYSLHERAALRARAASARAYARDQLTPLVTHLTHALTLAEEFGAGSGPLNRRR